MIRKGFLLLGLLAAFTALPVRAESPMPCPDIPAAEAGNAQARFDLGLAYQKGLCVEKNARSALKWLERSAEQGHAPAQHALGEIYFTGADLPAADYPKAKEWHAKAALQGHGPSQLRLAFLYAENHFKGLDVDYAEAEKWFIKAAEQNAGDARFRLGNFYHHYKNPPDYVKAVEWLTRAAEDGHRTAMFDLATFYREGKAVPQDLGKSLEWLIRAGTGGVLPAQIMLAEAYGKGENGASKDPTQSFLWAKRIADQGAAPVYWLNHVADILYKGQDGIPKNHPLALKYYERAARKDDPHALERAAEMHLNGLGTPKDPVKAKAYREQAGSR